MHMEKEDIKTSKKPAFSIGCMPWPAVFLSAVIITVRALQPNAEPMTQWSVASWLLMLSPVFMPFLIWTALLFLSIISAISFEVCK